jgi:hypothetical protein
MIKSLQDKTLIFTITTGRSGTGYLANLLGNIPNIATFHEADPRFSMAFRRTQSDGRAAMEFWVEQKLPAIAAVPESVYIETSHLFCKGFVEPLLELGIVPDIILLERPHRDVATSMYLLDTIPGRTEKALKYYLSPDDPKVLALPKWRSLHDYQLCYWYCLEIERRSTKYEQLFRSYRSTVVRTSLHEFSTYKGFLSLIWRLKLPRMSFMSLMKFRVARRRRVNTKARQKKELDLSVETLDSLEEQVRSLVSYL